MIIYCYSLDKAELLMQNCSRKTRLVLGCRHRYKYYTVVNTNQLVVTKFHFSNSYGSFHFTYICFFAISPTIVLTDITMSYTTAFDMLHSCLSFSFFRVCVLSVFLAGYVKRLVLFFVCFSFVPHADCVSWLHIFNCPFLIF